MASTITQKRTKWSETLAKLEAQMVALDAAILKAMTEIESYKFDSNEGAQQVKYRDLDKMLKSQTILQKQIDWYERKICGQGIRRFSMKRQLY